MEKGPLSLLAEADTLYQIMQMAQNVDDGTIELSKEAEAQLADLFHNKVDAYKYYLASEDSLIGQKKALITVLESLIDEHQQAIDLADKRSRACQSHLLSLMNAFNFTKIAGEHWTFKIRESKAVEIIHPEFEKPDAALYELFPDFIRRKEAVTYSWNKLDLRAAIESGEQDIGFAKVNINQHLKTESKGK